MKQKMNGSLMKLKRSTWPVPIKVTAEYGMIWNAIMESRLTINVCSESVGRKESSPQSSIPTTDAPYRLPTLSILQRMY
jgi:hypothetical protein